eukprot:m.733418 g.733418  ORF g.733418 m.733418 type:complete len:901 (+) comp23071_c0_seq3:232-2934(+)
MSATNKSQATRPGASKSNSALASAFDAVVEGSDLAASMERLMDDFDDDNDPTTNSGSILSPWGIGFGGNSTASTASEMPDLITPDMFMQIPTTSETTSVAGVSTASIWSNLGSTPSVPSTKEKINTPSSSMHVARQTNTPDGEPLTLQELEARLQAKSTALPPALDGSTPARPRPAPASKHGGERSTGAANAWGLPPSSNDGGDTHTAASAPAPAKHDAAPQPSGGSKGGGAAGSGSKGTPPILKQLQHAQGQHALQQKLTAERQRVDVEIKRLETLLHSHRQALAHHHQHAHAARMSLHAATTATDHNGADGGSNGHDKAELQRLSEVVQTHVRAASEIERTCAGIVQTQVALGNAFEKFHLTLMIEHGQGDTQRPVLTERKQHMLTSLEAQVTGLHQLDKHMAHLQHRYGQMMVKTPPVQSTELVELRNQIQATAQHHATAVGQHKMLTQQLAHTDMLLGMLPKASTHTVAGEQSEHDPSRYNNLMSWSEKKWLIKIQAKQMFSENPYVDDFYAHAVARKRAAAMRAAAMQAGAPLPPSLFPTGPTPMGKHKRDKVHAAAGVKPEYMPSHFDHALGTVRGTNIRAPQKLIAVPTAPNAGVDPDGPEDDKSRENADKARRRKVLLLIEQGYRHLLQAEDRSIKLETPTLSVRARAEIEKERSTEVAAVLNQFHIAPADQTAPPPDDTMFWRTVAYPKGQKLLARLMQFCNPVQAHAVLQLLLRNMVALVTPTTPTTPTTQHDARMESMSVHFLPVVAQVLEAMDIDVVVACMQTAVDRHTYDDDENKRRMFHKFCAALVYTVCRRADALLGAGTASPSIREQWTVLVEQYIRINVPTMSSLITAAASVDDIVHLWVFANILASHSGTDCRAMMREALGSAADKTPDHPVVSVFLQLVGK